jgi:hypothetical protein
VNDVARADVPPPRRPSSLIVALTAVGLEVLAIAAGGAVLLVDVVSGRVESVGSTLAMAAFAGLLAAILATAARALWQLRGWGRGPVMTWQVLQLAVGLSQLGSAPVAGGALVAVAVVALVGLLMPASVRAVAADARPPRP